MGANYSKKQIDALLEDEKHKDLAKLFKKNPRAVDYILEDGNTPLHLAVDYACRYADEYGKPNMECVRACIEARADIFVRNDEGQLASDIARDVGNQICEQFLNDAKAKWCECVGKTEEQIIEEKYGDKENVH